MQPFLITGLPRSGTAWWAAVCNAVDGAICYHEPTAYLQRWQHVAKVWVAKNGYRHIGISDSFLGLHLEAIAKIWAPRILVISRPYEDVRKSLSDISIYSDKYLEALLWRLSSFLSSAPKNVMSVPFDDLFNDIDLVVCAMEFLMPGAYIPREKVNEYIRFNIQQTEDARAVGVRCAAELAEHTVIEFGLGVV